MTAATCTLPRAVPLPARPTGAEHHTNNGVVVARPISVQQRTGQRDTTAPAEPSVGMNSSAEGVVQKRSVCVSVTVKLTKKQRCTLAPAERKKKMLVSCRRGCVWLNVVGMPDVRQRGLCVKAIAGLEIGAQKSNAHLQTGWHWLIDVSEEDSAAVHACVAWLGPAMAAIDPAFTWKCCEPHVHTDPKMLFGYCYKEHTKRLDLTSAPFTSQFQSCTFQTAVLNCTAEELAAAYRHWLRQTGENEGGESSWKITRPGVNRNEQTTLPNGMLHDIEYFEHSEGMAPLNLSVAKLLSFFLQSGMAKLHTQFASHSGRSHADPVVQNLFYALRKDASIARSLSVINVILYGHDGSGNVSVDMSHVDTLLQSLQGGPPRVLTDQLEYAEAQLAVRTGALPARAPFFGKLLQSGLQGYAGRVVVIDPHGCSESFDYLRMCQSDFKLLATAHVQPLGVADRVAVVVIATDVTQPHLRATTVA